MWITKKGCVVIILLLVATVITDRGYIFYARSISRNDITNSQQQRDIDRENTKDFRSPVLASLGEIETIIDAHEHIIVLLSTVAIAFFTATLWKSTSALQAAAERQIEDMQISLGIAKEAAEAAKSSANTAERALLEYERPWVFVHILDRFREEKGGDNNRLWWEDFLFFVQFEIANHGRTPALIDECHIRAFISNEEPEFPIRTEQWERPIGPHEVKPCEIDVPTTIIAEMLVNPATGDSTPIPAVPRQEELFFRAIIVYADIAGKKHESRFCFRYVGPPDYWVKYDGGDEYNRLT